MEGEIMSQERWEWCEDCQGVDAVPLSDECLVSERLRCDCGTDYDNEEDYDAKELS